MAKVSVVIPSWNGRKLLEECLKSISKQTYRNFEVIVVDNGSIDDTGEYVKRRHPSYKLIRLGQNLGFATAVNRGIQQAEGEYIVLVNNDTKLDPWCLARLVGAADDHQEVGMIAAKMLNFFNPKIIDGAGGYIDAVGHANTIGYGEEDQGQYDEPKEVLLVSGGGGLFKKWVFQKVGLFDEDYFAYFEDVDLCLRAQLQGIKAWYEPKAVIYHMHKATSSKNQPLTEYLQFRNMTQTIIKDFPFGLLLHNFNWLRIILVNINTVRFLAMEGYFFSALKAEWYILTHIFDLLTKRFKIQKNTQVPVEDLINRVQPKRITLFGLLGGGI